ncbi:hypothetical protein HNY73_013131 [Argiope bruennichi]|uniref:Uncharacterized protein n=1 Tax=Argiope bruennichi TaxID=94029 RepID=A0A8T0F1V4_ARGBR|nr:hypothetical protein HNY73_013131 [Argiope bruennichi]
MIKYIILLTLFVAVAQCFVCPKNFCDKVECEDLSSCRAENGYKVREKGGWCRCCDICVKVLGEYERCRPPIELGVIYRSECAEGLYCSPELERCIKE